MNVAHDVLPGTLRPLRRDQEHSHNQRSSLRGWGFSLPQRQIDINQGRCQWMVLSTLCTTNPYYNRYKTAVSAILVPGTSVFMYINGHDYLLLCHKTCIPVLRAEAALDSIENTMSSVRMYSNCVEERWIMYIQMPNMNVLYLSKHEYPKYGWKQTKRNQPCREESRVVWFWLHFLTH